MELLYFCVCACETYNLEVFGLNIFHIVDCF